MFGAAELAAVYTGPGSLPIAFGGRQGRAFLDRDLVTQNDGVGVVTMPRTVLRVQAGALAGVALDTIGTVDGRRYRLLSGPEPIDDGAEELHAVMGPL